MAVKKTKDLEPQNPLILRCNRLMEAFAKSDDERDFYLDRREGFIIYADLDKPLEDLQILEKELKNNPERYCLIPKLTFYETKKIMEGFINEKVYDIDTKEKLIDIIQSKEARENFLEFIYDHHSELEKWQAYYQERSRIRIIEWLRINNFQFVFEEDLDIPALLLEKLKRELFETKIGKDVATARKTLFSKSKTYYSNEALNPRPKRGRPPKQAVKTEVEKQVSTDIYTTVPNGLLGFLFIPDLTGASSATFSSRFGNEADLFTQRRAALEIDDNTASLDQKLAAIRMLSSKWKEPEPTAAASKNGKNKRNEDFDEEDVDDAIDYDEEEDDEEEFVASNKKTNSSKQQLKGHIAKNGVTKTAPAKPTAAAIKVKPKTQPKVKPKAQPPKKKVAAAPAKKVPAKKVPAKKAPPAKTKVPAKKAVATKKVLKPLKKITPKAAPKVAAKAKPKPKPKAAPAKKKVVLRPLKKLKKK